MCCDTVTVSPEFAAAIDGGSRGATVINAELALIKGEGGGEHASDKLAEDDFLLLRQVVYFETTCVAVAVEAGPTRQLIRALQAYGLGSLEEAASIYGTVTDISNGLVHEGLHDNSTFTDDSCILGPKARKVLLKVAAALKQSVQATAAAKPPGAQRVPVRRLDLVAAHLEQGFSGFSRATAPARAMVYKAMVDKEDGHQVAMPFADLRFAPWSDAKWAKAGGGEEFSTGMLQAVGAEAAALGDAASAADLLKGAALRRAATISSTSMTHAHFVAALSRYMTALAVAGALGPKGMPVVLGYLMDVNLLVVNRSCPFAQLYDKKLHEDIAATEVATAGVVARLSGLDAVVLQSTSEEKHRLELATGFQAAQHQRQQAQQGKGAVGRANPLPPPPAYAPPAIPTPAHVPAPAPKREYAAMAVGGGQPPVRRGNRGPGGARGKFTRKY